MIDRFEFEEEEEKRRFLIEKLLYLIDVYPERFMVLSMALTVFFFAIDTAIRFFCHLSLIDCQCTLMSS
ncbi:MAG: hypothetical protein AAGA80_06565 [Cyanobacteria bacterium P01_F01_bin.143]